MLAALLLPAAALSGLRPAVPTAHPSASSSSSSVPAPAALQAWDSCRVTGLASQPKACMSALLPTLPPPAALPAMLLPVLPPASPPLLMPLPQHMPKSVVITLLQSQLSSDRKAAAVASRAGRPSGTASCWSPVDCAASCCAASYFRCRAAASNSLAAAMRRNSGALSQTALPPMPPLCRALQVPPLPDGSAGRSAPPAAGHAARSGST